MPSFYKVNLFNEIAKERNILVLYTGSNEGVRSSDFSGVKEEYECIHLHSNKMSALLEVLRLHISYRFIQVIVSGWDNIIPFPIVILHNKAGNGCILESSIQESGTTGFKAVLKRFLLNRVATVYASGKSQRLLAQALGFKGKIVEFGGCGILNYQPQPIYCPREKVKEFLYVGRLIEVKNVSLLISVFNDLPELNLTIIGDGVLRDKLKRDSNGNIRFLGAKKNKELAAYYKEADVFILPSSSETWGLVVEEALNNGTPVIVSSAVGCADSIVIPYSSGLVFDNNDRESLKSAIEKMCELDFYNYTRQNVAKMDFIQRAKQQVESFVR